MPRAFDRPRSPLGELLIRLRRDHGGVSQGELARRTKGAVSAGHIGQIETGDRGASADTRRALGEALGLSPDEQAALFAVPAVDVPEGGDIPAPLDQEQEELLAAWRDLDPAGREELRAHLRMMVAKHHDDLIEASRQALARAARDLETDD